MASSLITTYLGSGLAAARPVAPDVPTGGSAAWYSTDTDVFSVWDGTIWNDVGAAAGNWWFSPPTLATLPTAVTDGTFTVGPAAADDADAGLILTGKADAPDESFMRLKVAPAAPFSVKVRVQALARGADGHFNFGGLILRESGSGKKVIFGSGSNGKWLSRRATGTTLGADITVGGDGTGLLTTDGNYWFRADVDASFNVTMFISQDGKSWAEVSSVTAATVGWATVDQVGVGIYVRANSGLAMAATFEHFSEA